MCASIARFGERQQVWEEENKDGFLETIGLKLLFLCGYVLWLAWVSDQRACATTYRLGVCLVYLFAGTLYFAAG
jgi:hypothetical protein